MLGMLLMLEMGCETLVDCAKEPAAISQVNLDVLPDFSFVLEPDAENFSDLYEDLFDLNENNAGEVLIEAWDCVDLSWWSPIEEAKVVQLWSNPNSCGDFQNVSLTTHPCFSDEGPDAPYRED